MTDTQTELNEDGIVDTPEQEAEGDRARGASGVCSVGR